MRSAGQTRSAARVDTPDMVPARRTMKRAVQRSATKLWSGETSALWAVGAV